MVDDREGARLQECVGRSFFASKDVFAKDIVQSGDLRRGLDIVGIHLGELVDILEDRRELGCELLDFLVRKTQSSEFADMPDGGGIEGNHVRGG